MADAAMKERELRAAATCGVCQKKIGESRLPLFWRVWSMRTIEPRQPAEPTPAEVRRTMSIARLCGDRGGAPPASDGGAA